MIFNIQILFINHWFLIQNSQEKLIILMGIYMHFRRGEKNNLKIFILLYCKLLKAIPNVHPSEIIIVTLFYDSEFNIWC